MMKMSMRKAGYVAGALALTGVLAWLVVPEPVEVEPGEVTVGPMQVTVDDQGETRAHDRFVVSAPVSGRLLRMELHDGDGVSENQVIARIAPLPLSVQDREAQLARVAAAEAQEREAREYVRRAEENLALAAQERVRIETLVKEGNLPVRQADQARNAEATAANEVEAARFRVKSAGAQVRLARTGLAAMRDDGTPAAAAVEVRSPVAGRVLRINDPSERVVAAGTPLLAIGDLARMEVVIELLSGEAVQVRPGMPVLIEGWGGERPLRGRVRLVEPFAFTKVSALGVEEKRTRVIVDFVDPPGPLGDGFRVTGRIVTWQAAQVTKVPGSALFRCGGAWCTFVIEHGRAVQRTVDVGRRNPLEAEVRGGLVAGDHVIRHPTNAVADGTRVAVRTAL